MKLAITILSFYSVQPVINFWEFLHPTVVVVYHVKNAGNDALDGLTDATAWQHVAKVNSSSFNAGDSILFKRGDSWSEVLRIPSSGTNANHIIFGAYGTGVKPEFTGLANVTMSSIGSNLYTGTITSGALYQNTILVNGNIAKKGRYPNSTYLSTNDAGSTQTMFIATGLLGNYVGAELVTFPVYHWIIDVNRIASQTASATSDTFRLATPFTYAGVTQYKYFLQNLPSLCDQEGDYAYDSTTKVVTVYSALGTPTVKASTIDTLVLVDNKNYITFTDLTINGANSDGIMKDSTVGITITNCTIKNIGGVNPQPVTLGGLGGAAIRGEHTDKDIVTYDSIMNNLNNGVMQIHNTVTSNRIFNYNYLKNTGAFPGMGCSNNGSYYAYTDGGGDSCQYKYNRIDTMGYMGINFGASNSSVYHNYITNFCLWKSDGSAIGSSHLDGGDIHGTVIKSNITIGGINDTYHFISAGIYMDGTYLVTIDGNTVSNCDYHAVLMGTTSKMTFINNNIDDSIGFCLNILGNNTTQGSGLNYYNHNSYYQRRSATATWVCMDFGYSATPQSVFDMDSNYYSRPILHDTNFIRNSFNNTYFSTASAWSGAFGFDTHSYNSPTGITSAPGVLYINPTEVDTTIIFSGRKIDTRGNIYDNQITLHPFESANLFIASIQPTPTVLDKKVGGIMFH